MLLTLWNLREWCSLEGLLIVSPPYFSRAKWIRCFIKRLEGWNDSRHYWSFFNCPVITKASDHGFFMISIIIILHPHAGVCLHSYTLTCTCLCLPQAGVPYSDADPGGAQGGGGQRRSGRFYSVLQERPPLAVLRGRGERVLRLLSMWSNIWGEKCVKDLTKIALFIKRQRKVTQPACLYASFSCGTPQCWACFIKVPY